MNIIEVKGLEKTYLLGDIEVNALRGVSFDIEKSQFSAIMGPSGSGKSTLMRIMAGIDKDFTGEAWHAEECGQHVRRSTGKN